MPGRSVACLAQTSTATEAGTSVITTGTANLKGKIGTLDELITQLAEDMNFHKKEVFILKSEKENLEAVL